MTNNRLVERIRTEILQSSFKKITFRRFMELCLYHPTWGYYCREDRTIFGKRGDFFTNVQVGSLFGRLLGAFFLHMQSQSEIRGEWALVEMGGRDGHLMQTIISFFRERAIKHVDFYIVEKSCSNQTRKNGVTWVNELTMIPRYPFAMIFSNELVDAFPVHRLVKRSGRIEEIYVTWDEQRQALQETTGFISNEPLRAHVAVIQEQIKEGQQFEVQLESQKWLNEISQWLDTGYVVTIDYGGDQEELLLRKEGTLRYFQHHTLVQNSYDQPGEVDMTAHVNFQLLKEHGKQVGLTTIFYGSQTRFILDQHPVKLITNENDQHQLKQLMHPDGMGEAFRVLIQKK